MTTLEITELSKALAEEWAARYGAALVGYKSIPLTQDTVYMESQPQEFDDYLDYLDEREERFRRAPLKQQYRLDNASEAAKQEERWIWWLTASVDGQRPDRFDQRKAALLAAGYSQDALDTVQRKSHEQYKLDNYKERGFQSPDEWLTDYEMEQYPTVHPGDVIVKGVIALLEGRGVHYTEVHQMVTHFAPAIIGYRSYPSDSGWGRSPVYSSLKLMPILDRVIAEYKPYWMDYNPAGDDLDIEVGTKVEVREVVGTYTKLSEPRQYEWREGTIIDRWRNAAGEWRYIIRLDETHTAEKMGRDLRVVANASEPQP